MARFLWTNWLRFLHVVLGNLQGLHRAAFQACHHAMGPRLKSSGIAGLHWYHDMVDALPLFWLGRLFDQPNTHIQTSQVIPSSHSYKVAAVGFKWCIPKQKRKGLDTRWSMPRPCQKIMNRFWLGIWQWTGDLYHWLGALLDKNCVEITVSSLFCQDMFTTYTTASEWSKGLGSSIHQC